MKMNDNETKLSQPVASKSDLTTPLTDAQLTARIILTFYHFPDKLNLTIDEIYEFLKTIAMVEKERILPLLKVLEKEWLVGSLVVHEEGQQEQEYWSWAIRMGENGQPPYRFRTLKDYKN